MEVKGKAEKSTDALLDKIGELTKSRDKAIKVMDKIAFSQPELTSYMQMIMKALGK